MHLGDIVFTVFDDPLSAEFPTAAAAQAPHATCHLQGSNTISVLSFTSNDVNFPRIFGRVSHVEHMIISDDGVEVEGRHKQVHPYLLQQDYGEEKYQLLLRVSLHVCKEEDS